MLLDGEPVRSCLMLAVQADGSSLTTVEGLAGDGLHPLQQAFADCHGLQCGFCTPGFLISAPHLLTENPDPSREEIRAGLSGNICRRTGYVGIVDAIRQAASATDATSPSHARSGVALAAVMTRLCTSVSLIFSPAAWQASRSCRQSLYTTRAHPNVRASICC